MPAVQQDRLQIAQELAELFASSPTPEQILAFHPSPQLQQRATELLYRLKSGLLSEEESEELDEFERAETFMRLVKANVRKRLAP